VGEAVRVEGWREYISQFGGLAADAVTSYALHGYFANGGEVAHVVRLASAPLAKASAIWIVGDPPPQGKNWPGRGGFQVLGYRVESTSPGQWANDTVVRFRYYADGPDNRPAVEITVQAAGEPTETICGIDPAKIEWQVKTQSNLIRLHALPLPAGLTAANLQTPSAPDGPRYLEWLPLTLTGGQSGVASSAEYQQGITTVGDEPEIALVAVPDLFSDFPCDSNDLSGERINAKRVEILAALLAQAETLHDRMVIIDIPPESADPRLAIDWLTKLYQQADEVTLRAGAVYHPRLMITDPLGGSVTPTRIVPSSGHVAGVISKTDRDRGAHYTPANVLLVDLVDLDLHLDDNQQALLYQNRINLLRCAPGRGLQVWGGRTLSANPDWVFVAHRRLIQHLVRAIRRVAEPLVFETNGPELWLTLVRAITSMLLEVYRRGGLKGDRPEDGFRVRCDQTNNPPEQQELGQVLCEVALAPAVPMEFMVLRVALSAQGVLEVFES
jgi:hypothetical protein